MALKDPILQQGFEIICKNLTEQEEQIADIKANCDYVLEGKVLEIKTLGERCNQLLKDKGDLTDKVSNQAESLRITMLEEEKKGKQIEELEQQIEKMKCCANCNNTWNGMKLDICADCKNFDKWEIKENG